MRVILVPSPQAIRYSSSTVGFATPCSISVSYTHLANRPAAFTPSPKPALTPGQAEALRVINEARAAARGDVVVVDGVTGSGKTEVYLQAIEATLAAGRTARWARKSWSA